MKQVLSVISVFFSIYAVAEEKPVSERIVGSWELKSVLCRDGSKLLGLDVVSGSLTLDEFSKIKDEKKMRINGKLSISTSEGTYKVHYFKGLPCIDARVFAITNGIKDEQETLWENHSIEIANDNNSFTMTQAEELQFNIENGLCPKGVPTVITWTRKK